MDYLTKAIKNLQPSAEFSFNDDDYSTIKWDVLDGNAPTKKEIDDEIKRIKAAQVTEAEAKATAKAALLNKLGITAEEANLLLS
jgi:hypothetical protein